MGNTFSYSAGPAGYLWQIPCHLTTCSKFSTDIYVTLLIELLAHLIQLVQQCLSRISQAQKKAF